MDNRTFYQNLYKAWSEICKNKSDAQAKVNAYWKGAKNSMSSDDLANAVKIKILGLKNIKMRTQPTLSQSFLKGEKKTEPTPDPGRAAEATPQVEIVVPCNPTAAKRSTPVQDKLKEQLLSLDKTIDSLENIKHIGNESTQTLLTTNKMKRSDVLKRIRKLEKLKITQQKYRKKVKDNVNKFKNSHPELAKELKLLPVTKTGPGRPRIEESQPLLLQTIVEIVSRNSSADPRRRTENLQSCRTLTHLHEELLKLGFRLSRSATYLRLLPRNIDTVEGRRHVVTVPVKLIKPQNDFHSVHPDGHFAAATINFLRDLAQMLGSKVVFVLSQDDKARVPIGLVAAHKQSPMLMKMDYRIRLPDHDWVIASRHKLIPSVYAALDFDKKNKLSYSGPTYIEIRSGKHDKSTAQNHSIDLHRLVNLEAFKPLACTGSGEFKPIFVLFVDGGPDENPRYPRTISEAILHFKKFNLDALFIACYATGQSAFNPVERRMAPLSKDLSGVILPHDHYGTHLNREDKTINDELEIQNFQKAGQCLASIWNENVIDGYPIFSEYLDPRHENQMATKRDEKWFAIHVRVSKYLLQIIKCDNLLCCTAARTNIKLILPNGFIPAPVLFYQNEEGVCSHSTSNSNEGHCLSLEARLTLNSIVPKIPGLNALPYDFYCPSATNLANNICKCGTSFPTKTAYYLHSKVVHNKRLDQILEDEIAKESNLLSNMNTVMEGRDTVMETILNVSQRFEPIFEDI